MSKTKKTVLVAPLDWGLGHASRCIPIVHLLLKYHNVVLAGSGNSLRLLAAEFPELKTIQLKTTTITYAKHDVLFGLKMFLNIPKIILNIVVEKVSIRQIVGREKIDVIISDNRLGLFHKNVKSIFMTHQVNILLPKSLKFLNPFVNAVNHFFIKQYDECWVPDFAGDMNLAGRLSHGNLKFTVKYIGLLSRFNFSVNETIRHKVFDILVILSGPEPQRSVLEATIMQQLKTATNYRILVIRGKIEGEPNSCRSSVLSHITICNYATSQFLKDSILKSNIVVSRSGYSSIMDYVTLGSKAILIPTPGQTEQVYLAEYLKSKGWFYSTTQSNLNILDALKISDNFSINRFKTQQPSSVNLAEMIRNL